MKIEEIVDDEKPENSLSKKAKKKKSQSSMSDDNENSNRQIVVKAGRGLPVVLSEDEDEDGFPIPAQEKKSDISKSEAELEETINKRIGEKTQKRDRKDDVAHGKKLKRKIDDAEQDEKPERWTNFQITRKDELMSKQLEITRTDLWLSFGLELKYCCYLLVVLVRNIVGA